MKITAIISEYNPFHNGHLLHIKKTRELIPKTHIVCVMSGNFVQRGEAAIADKWTRAQMALRCGADIVIELPFLYATQNAQGFATGAVRLIESLNSVAYLSFGSECGSVAQLQNQARLLSGEPEEFKQALRKHLDAGLSFPRARHAAMAELIGETGKTSISATPNDILAVEYLRALNDQKSNMIPICVRREGAGYHDAQIDDRGISSATAIRAAIAAQGFSPGVLRSLPAAVFQDCASESNLPFHPLTDLGPYFRLLLYRLRGMGVQDIAAIHDVSEGLEYRIREAAARSETLEGMISQIKCKRYTRARISRILLHCLLGVTKNTMIQADSVLPYARVLGFRPESEPVFSHIASRSHIPVVTRMPQAPEGILTKFDVLATDIYSLLHEKIAPAGRDYTQKIIIA